MLAVLVAAGCAAQKEVAPEPSPAPSEPALEHVSAGETTLALEDWWETTTDDDRADTCRRYDNAPNSAVRRLLRSDDVEFDAEAGSAFLGELCGAGVPEPIETPSPAPTPTAAPPPEPTSEDLWERYGAMPDGFVEYLEDDYFLAYGPMNCADISAGKIETGWLHGVLTGGNLPDYVKPQPLGVYTIVRSIELSCPDLLDDFTALLDGYDAAHSPYPY